jgi:hypothetical protein
MDHILENDGKPVPDMASVASTNAPARTADEDDEDLEALRIQSGGAAGNESSEANSSSGGVAQVRNKRYCFTFVSNNIHTVYQMLAMWQDLP